MRSVAVLGVAFLLVSLVPAALAQDAAETAVIAKNLAENILGKGQVRSSRVLGGVREMDFEIVLGKRSLCTGSAGRERPCG